MDRLYANIVTSDGEDFISSLNDIDRSELEAYMASRKIELSDLQSKAIQRQIAAHSPSSSSVSIIPTQSYLVSDISAWRSKDNMTPQDARKHLNYSAILTYVGALTRSSQFFTSIKLMVVF